MGCIHSRTVVEQDLNPAPLACSHPTKKTQKTDNTADTCVIPTNKNTQEPQEGHSADASATGQVTANRKVVLGDIEVEYSPDDESSLDGLILAIFGLEDEESASLQKSSGTTWSWPGVITLRSNMNKLIFVVRSKDGEELGRIFLSSDELRGFLAVQDDTEEEREIPTRKAGLSLKLTFTINVFGEPDDRTAAYSSEEIEQMVKDTAKNPTSFPNFLAQLADEGPDNLHLFGIYFTHRFEETGKVDDINHAIEAYELAMKHTNPDYQAHATYVHGAGTGYLSRFTLFGNIADIEQALSFLVLSTSQSEEGDAALPERFSRLGIAYRVRFKATGDLVDVENAISSQQRGVQLTQANHPDLAARLASLGNTFKARFDRKADLADINSAIINTERAIGMSTERHDDMPMWYNNLGSFHQMRFNKTGEIKDSEVGIKHQEKGIHIAPKKHPKMAAWLNNLGCSYQIRFGRTKKVADIEKAIEVQTQAVEMTGDGYMQKPLFLRSLGISYHARFRATEDLTDIDNAIDRHQQAVGLTPDGHADLPSRLGSLGTSFYSRFKHSGDKTDVLSAITSFRNAATYSTGRPSTRLSAARKWGLLCRLHDPLQSLEAFRVVIELLSQVAGLEQTVQKRHMSLMDIPDLTMTAAATAMDQREHGTAVEWLEQGRCLVWNQIHQLRTPAGSLRARDPELAKTFLRVARALEESGSRQETESFDAGGTDDMSHLIATQDEIHVHVQLAKEYHTLLAKIRGISGFEDFLQPPKTSDLLEKLPKDSAVVTFVVHEDRCDALILKRGLSSPIHVPLSKMTLERALGLTNELRLMLRGLRMREVNRDGDRSRGRGEETTISKILEELWVKVVEGVVRSLSGEIAIEQTERQRIWWCPTGSLAFLPLHAAGVYKKDSPFGFNVLDFVVSSYTPTISAFLYNLDKPRARGTESLHATVPVVPTSLLLVSQPNTPGLSPIPGTTEETQEIQRLMNATVSTGPVVRALLLEGGEATVARVKDELKSHSWVHFACHAIQDVNSLKSGLHLHDKRLELLEIMKQRTMVETATNAKTTAVTEWDLAFLSACQTGTGDEKLSDEVVHIAAGMLAVGYRGVVATMWSIKDAYGKDVAVNFYKHLLGELSTRSKRHPKNDGLGGAAWALDRAVSDLRKTLRDSEEGLLIWVPYVHYGV